MFVALSNPPSVNREPAPLTSWRPDLPSGNIDVSAFWGADDRYYLCVQHPELGDHWYVGEGPVEATVRFDALKLMPAHAEQADRTAPRGRPVLLGRTSHRTDGTSATTVLAGRAGRSLRWPA